jgi:polyhydroxyalkanoate synthesis repressor PhaR
MTTSSCMGNSFRALGVVSLGCGGRGLAACSLTYVIRRRPRLDKAQSGRIAGMPAALLPGLHKTVAAPAETAYFVGRVVRLPAAHLNLWFKWGCEYMAETMTKTAEPITIKKYANRRLYNTGTSTYVTLEDLAAMVKTGEDFVVYDAKTGEEITRSVLTQIIFEQENKEGQNLLPIAFLRQLIRFYGDSMQMLVPRYLEVSIESLTREQEKFRNQMAQAFGVGAFTSLEDQVRRNMEMFERAFTMFAPFARRESGAAETPEPEKVPTKTGDFDDLKRQLDEMKRKVDKLTEKEPGKE